MKTKNPTHKILIYSEPYRDIETGKDSVRWTSTIMRGKKILWSSTSQLYSRKIDAQTPAQLFLDAAKTGRVAIEIAPLDK